MSATICYADYDGPGRGYAIVDGNVVPMDANATRRLAQNAALLSLVHSMNLRARAMCGLVDRYGRYPAPCRWQPAPEFDLGA